MLTRMIKSATILAHLTKFGDPIDFVLRFTFGSWPIVYDNYVCMLSLLMVVEMTL